MTWWDLNDGGVMEWEWRFAGLGALELRLVRRGQTLLAFWATEGGDLLPVVEVGRA